MGTDQLPGYVIVSLLRVCYTTVNDSISG